MIALIVLFALLGYVAIGTAVWCGLSYVVERFDFSDWKEDVDTPIVIALWWVPVTLVLVFGTAYLISIPTGAVQRRALRAAKQARLRRLPRELDEELLAALSQEERDIVESVVRRRQ